MTHFQYIYLGVIYYHKFNFREHISKMCQTNHHIRDLRRIRRHLPLSIVKTIATALVTSRLNHCNTRFHNIAIKDITKLKRVQKPLLTSLH